MTPIQFGDLRIAALLRAHFSVKTPDALQLAAGIRNCCAAFLTNDRRLPSAVFGLSVFQLEDFSKPHG